MNGPSDIEFVNRDSELRFLEEKLLTRSSSPAKIIVRSPTGFGKSSLTDQLRVSSRIKSDVCVVDPDVRGGGELGSVHAGYFLQRIAEALDELRSTGGQKGPSFRAFIRANRLKMAKFKDPADIISDAPSVKHLYKTAFEYLFRFGAIGKYSAKNLLRSDQSASVRICEAYVEQEFTNQKIVVVVREAQHIDNFSLRAILALARSASGPSLILEYTSETASFQSRHHEILLRAAQSTENFVIFDLVRLQQPHLQYLLTKHVDRNIDLKSETYAKWDGNLRSIVEMRFRIAVGQPIPLGAEHNFLDVESSVDEHLISLDQTQRLILAMLFANVEPINVPVLVFICTKINGYIRISQRPDRFHSLSGLVPQALS